MADSSFAWSGRPIDAHRVPGQAMDLDVLALDGPGPGGASHLYGVSWPGSQVMLHISFQKGPIAEAGFNGLSNEALLAIILDRLAAFQAGPYKCAENAVAIQFLTGGMNALKQRTAARLARNVEGTSTP